MGLVPKEFFCSEDMESSAGLSKVWECQLSCYSGKFESVFYSKSHLALILYQWVNGVEAVQHSGGYLPFEAMISKHLKFGHSNVVTVAVNNTLTPWTIPQG